MTRRARITDRRCEWQSGKYYTHFRPDGTGLDTIQRAFGVDSTDIDSTYSFAEVRAGDDIDIGHITTTAPYGEERSYALTEITLADQDHDRVLEVSVMPDPLPAPDTTIEFIVNTDVAWTGGSPPDGTPQIFLTTNGDITATEIGRRHARRPHPFHRR